MAITSEKTSNLKEFFIYLKNYYRPTMGLSSLETLNSVYIISGSETFYAFVCVFFSAQPTLATLEILLSLDLMHKF